jgi:hypothetical protein
MATLEHIVKIHISNDDCLDHWNNKKSAREWRLNGRKRIKVIETNTTVETKITMTVANRLIEHRIIDQTTGRIQKTTRWYNSIDNRMSSEETPQYIIHLSPSCQLQSITDKEVGSRLNIYGRGNDDVVLETRTPCGLLQGYQYRFNYNSVIQSVVDSVRQNNRLTYSFDCDARLITVAKVSVSVVVVVATLYHHGVVVSSTLYDYRDKNN